MIKKVLSALLVSIVLSLLTFKVAMAADPLSDYDKYLKSLPKTSTSSVIKAKDKFITTCTNKQPAISEKCYLKFQAFYFSLIDNLSKKELNIPAGKEKQLAQTYRKDGVELWTSEGMYFAGPYYEFIDSSFSKYLPAAWKEYFQFRIKENNEGYLEDAGLVISWEKLRERITFLETFIKKYPDFPLIAVVKNNLADYVNSYVLGSNNLPVSESYDDKKLRKEAKLSYEKFLTANKSSKYYTLISEYYKLLKGQKFMVTDAIIQTMNKKLPQVVYDEHYQVMGSKVE